MLVLTRRVRGLRQSLRIKDFPGLFANVSFVGSQALAEEFKELGPQYGEGVIVTQVVPIYTSYASGVLRYREALKKYFPNESPIFVSLEGYIVAELMVAALNKAGRSFDTESLVEAMESIRVLDLGIGSTISFSPSTTPR